MRKKKHNITKKEAQRRHAQRRAKERYGLEFSGKIRRAFLKTIRDGEAELVLYQSNRVSIYKIVYEGRDFYVIYDYKRFEIISFLTSGQIDILLQNPELDI